MKTVVEVAASGDDLDDALQCSTLEELQEDLLKHEVGTGWREAERGMEKWRKGAMGKK